MLSKITTLRKLTETPFNFKYIILVSTALFLIITGIAFIMVYQNAGMMSEIINNDFNQQQLIIARQIASQIDYVLKDMCSEIESLKQIEIGRHPDIRHDAMETVIMRNSRKGLLEIGLIDEENRIIELYDRTGRVKTAPPNEYIDYHFEHSDSIIMGETSVVPGAGENHIVTCLVYTSIPFNQEKNASLYIRLNITNLMMDIAHAVTSGKTGYSWVIDETGKFLYHPEDEFVGKDAFLARRERKPLISFSRINQIMKDKMLFGEEGTGTYISGWHRGIEGEIAKLIAFAPIESSLILKGHIWSVAVVAPISEVAEVVHTIYRRHFTTEFFLLVGLFIFALLAIAYHAYISTALRERVKQTEAELHQKERIYQKIVDRATDLIYMFDLENRVILLNQHSVDVFSNIVDYKPDDPSKDEKYSPSQIEWYIDRPIDKIFKPSNVTFLKNQINTMLQQQASITYRHKIRVKGRLIYLNTKLVPIRDEDNQIHQILGISRDVTERMELDHRLYNMEKLASIGTLAAGVAHEINNPLAIMLGFTDLLAEKFPEDSPERSDLNLIIEQGNIAKQVVENLLGFARITEGLEDVVDINQSVDKVINVVRNTLKTKEIVLRKEIPGDLPSVQCDAREFQQVVFNLINNAISAMEKKGGTLTLNAAEQDARVVFSVHDTGEGIPDEIKPLIFDPFFTTKKAGEGTGLGLSLSYGIVKKYGGSLTFSSISAVDEPDMESGSTFKVSLPVVKKTYSNKLESVNDTAHSGRR